MSRIHAPDDNKIHENRHEGATKATCPACNAEMSPPKLPQHIATVHGEGTNE